MTPVAVTLAPLAHAFGARYDLPVPLWLFVVGGAAVVFVSFLVVLPTAVVASGADQRIDPIPARRGMTVRGLIAWLVTGILVVAGFGGSQAVAENIITTVFWLLVWIAVPISCGIIGDWTRPFNPFAAIARAVDRESLRDTLIGGPALSWPRRLGWWPATLLFFAAACGELIYNGTATRPDAVAAAIAIYAVISAMGGLLFGADAWLERGEMFSVLFSTWGRLGWFRFNAPGRRGFGGGLGTSVEPSVSRLTFILLLLMSVTFDGLLATPAWKSARTRLPDAIAQGTTAYLLLETLAFIALVLLAWLVFTAFAIGVRAAGRLDAGVLETMAGLIPSLLPIAFGYLVAHNAEYLLINGQLLLPLIGNPAGLSNWPFHPGYPFNDSYEVNTNLVPSSVIWYLQVALIIAVHIAAVVIAHRFLARQARTEQRARRSEWPWIGAMVGYTMTSLWLLAQPIVQEGSSATAAALRLIREA